MHSWNTWEHEKLEFLTQYDGVQVVTKPRVPLLQSHNLGPFRQAVSLYGEARGDRLPLLLSLQLRLNPILKMKVALTSFMRYLICRVVLKKLTSSTFVSYYFTILSYISIKFSAHVLS